MMNLVTKARRPENLYKTETIYPIDCEPFFLGGGRLIKALELRGSTKRQ
jgi:hypothetical protein